MGSDPGILKDFKGLKHYDLRAFDFKRQLIAVSKQWDHVACCHYFSLLPFSLTKLLGHIRGGDTCYHVDCELNAATCPLLVKRLTQIVTKKSRNATLCERLQLFRPNCTRRLTVVK